MLRSCDGITSNTRINHCQSGIAPSQPSGRTEYRHCGQTAHRHGDCIQAWRSDSPIIFVRQHTGTATPNTAAGKDNRNFDRHVVCIDFIRTRGL